MFNGVCRQVHFQVNLCLKVIESILFILSLILLFRNNTLKYVTDSFTMLVKWKLKDYIEVNCACDKTVC